MGNYTIFLKFENCRRGRQATNFSENDPKILDLKSSSEQIIFRKLSLGAPDKVSPTQNTPALQASLQIILKQTARHSFYWKKLKGFISCSKILFYLFRFRAFPIKKTWDGYKEKVQAEQKKVRALFWFARIYRD